MKSIFSNFHMKAIALLVCIFLFGINTANAKFDYPGKLNTDCASVAGWIQLSDPFAGGTIDDCVVCHNPSGPDIDKTAVMNLDPKPRFSTAVCMAVIAEKTPTPPPPVDPPPNNDACDIDGDGYCPPEDCNEGDPLVHPGTPEICGDGVDNNCNGSESLLDDPMMQDANTCPALCTDNDGDLFSISPGCGPIDTDDNDPTVNPGTPENCEDGKDNNGDGYVDDLDPMCQMMNDEEKLKELKKKLKAHKKECKKKEKQLEREYEALKEKIEDAHEDEEEEDEDDEEDDEDEDDDEDDEDEDDEEDEEDD